MEQIRVTGSDDPVDMFLLEAMVHGSEKDPLDKFQIDYKNPVVEVCLTINGIEVPFAPVARGFFERGLACLDQEVEKKVKEILAETGLDRIRSALDRAEFEVERAVDEWMAKRGR